MLKSCIIYIIHCIKQLKTQNEEILQNKKHAVDLQGNKLMTICDLYTKSKKENGIQVEL